MDTTEATASFLDTAGRIKKPNPDDIAKRRTWLGKGVLGWMATRQPPHRPEKMREYGLEDSLNVDLTKTLREGLKAWDEGKGSGPQFVEVLWDCRFLIRFDLEKMPQNVKNMLLQDESDKPRLAVRWWTKYYYPKIVLVPENGQVAWAEGEDREVVLHSNIDSHKAPMLLALRPDTKKTVSTTMLNKRYKEGKTRGNTPLIASDWISTAWIRTLDQT